MSSFGRESSAYIVSVWQLGESVLSPDGGQLGKGGNPNGGVEASSGGLGQHGGRLVMIVDR